MNECQRATITAASEAARRAALTALHPSSSSGRGGDDPAADPASAAATAAAVEAAAEAGAVAGMYAARMSAMLFYRAPASIDARFQRSAMLPEVMIGAAGGGESAQGPNQQPTLIPAGERAGSSGANRVPKPHFSVSSYLHHQGKTFVGRFTPACYRALTHTLDSHDVGRCAPPLRCARSAGGSRGGRMLIGGWPPACESSPSLTSQLISHSHHRTLPPHSRFRRGRGSFEAALRALPHRTLVVGISSDVLYPLALSEELARLIPRAELHVLDSPHGHDRRAGAMRSNLRYRRAP